MKTFFKEYWIYILCSVLIVTIAYCLPKLFVLNIIGSDNWADYSETGTIGDTFGGLSAPFIGTINIILLFITLKRQNEFEKKQDEFNRSQISNQKEEQFKSVFFQLMQRQHELYKEIQGTFCLRFMRENFSGTQERTVSGIDYFKVAKHELNAVFNVLEDSADDSLKDLIINKYGIDEEKIKKYKSDCKSNKEKMTFAYKCFLDRHYELSSCHRHLYHILEFIKAEEESHIALFKGNDDNVKEINSIYKRFADILQASLTDDELLLAYYNCACFEKTEKLVLHFQFVENLRKEDLFNPSIDIIEGIKIKNKD